MRIATKDLFHMRYTVTNLQSARISPEQSAKKVIEVLHGSSQEWVFMKNIRGNVKPPHKHLLWGLGALRQLEAFPYPW